MLVFADQLLDSPGGFWSKPQKKRQKGVWVVNTIQPQPPQEAVI